MFYFFLTQYRLLLKIKFYQDDNLKEPEIVKELKKHPYQVKLAIIEAKKYNKKEIIIVLKLLAKLDYNLKSSPIKSETIMELFLLKI